jgi:ribosome-associated translation inhibitor RaiA
MESKIKFFGKLDKVTDEEKNLINERLATFEGKNENYFREMHVSIDCKPAKETFRGKHAFVCKVNLDSDRGRFHAEESEIGAENTLIGALKKIERQIEKKKS